MKNSKKGKASKRCEILSTNFFGDGPVQYVAGVITLENGKISYTANKGDENTMKSIMSEVTGDPKAWFRSLPLQYHGSALRASFVEEGATRTKRSTRKRS
jgi:hypothetical protein